MGSFVLFPVFGHFSGRQPVKNSDYGKAWEPSSGTIKTKSPASPKHFSPKEEREENRFIIEESLSQR